MNNYKIIAPDWFSQNIENFIKHFKCFYGKHNVSYLEIGVWEGRSLLRVIENILTRNNCKIYAIDQWIPYQELNEKELAWHNEAENNFDHNLSLALKNRNNIKVEKIKLSSSEAMRSIQTSSIDFAYIDGSHSAPDVLEDMVCVWRALKMVELLFVMMSDMVNLEIRTKIPN